MSRAEVRNRMDDDSHQRDLKSLKVVTAISDTTRKQSHIYRRPLQIPPAGLNKPARTNNTDGKSVELKTGSNRTGNRPLRS